VQPHQIDKWQWANLAVLALLAGVLVWSLLHPTPALRDLFLALLGLRLALRAWRAKETGRYQGLASEALILAAVAALLLS
jgi:hypothetical protein